MEHAGAEVFALLVIASFVGMILVLEAQWFRRWAQGRGGWRAHWFG